MPTIVENFDAVSIKNSSVQFKQNDGSFANGTKFGCVGSVEGETTLREIIKRCEGVEVAKKSKPEKMDITVSGHIPVQVVRDLFGLKTDNLKPGIYSYSKDSKGKEFIYTADVIDEFEEVTKLIAFPKAVSSTGFKFAIENGADEVAQLEIAFSCYPDGQGHLYYEALVSELNDPTIAETWHTSFDYALVEAIPTP
ncbi:phage tail protein [Bacillus suaedae]|uniref:Phage tail protein n=1 Tax=Halalkalibacter suaedae TaxID=2822140 RepID=A0A940WYZ4_9BACI|nr:phage tail protein [Bacillus suaedae]MBP3951126.1 phage tail protein [Bacillus suaedae]